MVWVQQWRRAQSRGEVVVVRYADDFIVGFQHQAEAERFLTELRERFAKFGLELHSEKTRLIEFGPWAAENRRRKGQGKPQTFDFLGFTHICGRKRSNGYFTVYRQSMRRRLQGKLAEVKAELRRHMCRPVPAGTGSRPLAVHGAHGTLPLLRGAHERKGAVVVPRPAGVAVASQPVAAKPERPAALTTHGPSD